MSIAARSIHGMNVCVLPSEHNDFRPLALRHKPLAFLSSFLIVAKVVAITVISLTPSHADLSTITVNRVVQLTNNERVKAGLPALKVNNQLAAAAQEKGQHMLQEDYFAHISPSGVTPWYWIQKNNYGYRVAGENLAIDFTEAEDVVAAWMASPSHKDNILHPDYTETGIAVVSGEFQGGTSIIVVHMFGNPLGTNVAAEIIETNLTPTPTTTPAPTSSSPPGPDRVAPRIPRISVVGDVVPITDTVLLQIEGESSSVVHLLINDAEYQSIPISDAGTVTYALSLGSVTDGQIAVRGYSSDAAGNRSNSSEPLLLQKDTSSARFDTSILSFAISPLFDTSRIAVLPFSGGWSELAAQYGSTRVDISPEEPVLLPSLSAITFTAADTTGKVATSEMITLEPVYDTTASPDEMRGPSNLARLSRRLMIGVLISLITLLILAIIINIRIQRPALITHASFVILLAGVLLLI